jgi:hypothetical protein
MRGTWIERGDSMMRGTYCCQLQIMQHCQILLVVPCTSVGWLQNLTHNLHHPVSHVHRLLLLLLCISLCRTCWITFVCGQALAKPST